MLVDADRGAWAIDTSNAGVVVADASAAAGSVEGTGKDGAGIVGAGIGAGVVAGGAAEALADAADALDDDQDQQEVEATE